MFEFEFFYDATVYDVIDWLREAHGLSIRKVAALASISPTTLTSMLDRRPAKVTFRTLDAIAQVFGLHWEDLYNYEDEHVPEVDATGKVPSFINAEDLKRIMSRLKDLSVSPVKATRSLNTRRPERKTTSSSEEFRRSIHFVLERLNNDGLMEAMRRILELEKEERYCIKTSNADKEDDE